MHERMKSEAPLAARMRPRTLDEFIGQEDIVGPGKLLRRAIEADRLFSSILLWGPPGTGKTTLAMVIANLTKSHFETLSAVLAGKAELREVIEQALERRKLYQQAHHPVRGRGAPLEQGPAGRPAAARGERHGHADRRDHREPLFRGDRGAGLALARLPAAPASEMSDVRRILNAR